MRPSILDPAGVSPAHWSQRHSRTAPAARSLGGIPGGHRAQAPALKRKRGTELSDEGLRDRLSTLEGARAYQRIVNPPATWTVSMSNSVVLPPGFVLNTV